MRLRLAADAEVCDFGLVAFLLDGFLRDGAQGLFIRVLWRLAMTANHFFSCHDPYEPVGFRCIPGNFHSVGTHSFPPMPVGVILLLEQEESYTSARAPC